MVFHSSSLWPQPTERKIQERSRGTSVALGIQHTVEVPHRRIDGNIFRVDVEDCGAERCNRCRNIHALPPQVARIEVDAEGVVRLSAKPQKGLRVVDAEAGVGFERNLDAAVWMRKPLHPSSKESGAAPTARRGRTQIREATRS